MGQTISDHGKVQCQHFHSIGLPRLDSGRAGVPHFQYTVHTVCTDKTPSYVIQCQDSATVALLVTMCQKDLLSRDLFYPGGPLSNTGMVCADFIPAASKIDYLP